MNRLSIYLSVITMLFTPALLAQKKTANFLKWEVLAELPGDNGGKKSLGFAGPVTGIHNNILIVAGGANFPDKMPWDGGKKKYYDDLYVYVKAGKKIELYKKKFNLPSAIAYPASCSTTEGILYAGGENENGISNKVFLLQWNKKTSAISTKQLPELPLAITNAAATAVGNMVYIAGGETTVAASNQLLVLDLNNTEAGWKQLPVIPKAVSHPVFAVQSNGKNTSIYLIGGRKKNSNGISDLYNSTFEFNIKKNQWEEKKPLPYSLCAGTGIAVSNNQILLFGGDKGTTFNKVETLIAAINAEKEETKKQELILQKNKLQSEHPGFSKEVLLYNTKNDTWKIIGAILFDTPVTTTAVKWESGIIIPSGEIKAGVRSPNILSMKILQKEK